MTEVPEIVDLDQCPVKPALRLGGAIAFVLTLFPMSVALCCMPLILAGFAATTAFIFKYQVRLELKYGMKVGIMACLLGFGASTVVYDLLWVGFDYQIGMDAYLEFVAWMVELLPEESRPQVLDGAGESPKQAFGFGAVVSQILMIFVCSGIGGAIGGALASAFFKKGRLAQ